MCHRVLSPRVIPDDGVAQGLAILPTPGYGRFALVGNTY